MTNELTVIDTDNGSIELSPSIIRKYIARNNNVTDEECYVFTQLCKYQKLNPFLREIYIVKYGNGAASTIVGKETYMKRAYNHPKYRGHKAWVSEDSQTATCEVYIDGFVVPITVTVDWAEYKQESPLWRSKPKTMLRKVAIVQAFREAFPETFGGLYAEDEMPIDQSTLDRTPINIASETVDSIQVETNGQESSDIATNLDAVLLIDDSQLESIKSMLEIKDVDTKRFLMWCGSDIESMSHKKASDAIELLQSKPDKKQEDKKDE